MKLSLRQLQIFQAIAQQGSTTQACQALALSQSATSAALHELEHILGTRLFDRVGKRLQLNDQGRALLPQAIRMLEAARQIESGFQSNPGGFDLRLRIGCSTTIGNYILPLLLDRLRQSNPSLRVDVDMGNSAAIIDKAARLEIDIGLIEGPCHAQAVSAQPWLTDELLLVAGSGSPLLQAKSVSRQALRQAAWLLREPGSGTREEVERFLLQHLHALPDARRIGSSEAIKHMVAADLGVSCLSRWVVADLLESGRLGVMATALPPLRRHFHIVHHRDKFLTPSLQCFLDLCAEFQARHPASSQAEGHGSP